MTQQIRIADTLALPLEVATQSSGFYGVKGSGKTVAAKVHAEEYIAAGVQVVAIDPTDAWWGLGASADGKGPGVAVYVFGGPHGHVPLEATAGELVADVIVDHGINAVLSLRHLRKAEQHRFVTAFAERLYHRKGEPGHRSALHLFIDEAHAFAPQQVQGETARMVGAIEDLVRMGRSSGIGCSLISQRPASVNNNVRTQCETLVCLRIMSPHDRKALDAWIEAHDSEGRRAEFLASLASLTTGEAWVWSPPLDLFQRVQIRRLRTFDSSATPKPGEERVEPRALAPVDVEALGERIAATRQQAEANDPRRLKARLAELERELAAARAQQSVEPERIVERVEVEVPLLTSEERDQVEAVQGSVDALVQQIAGLQTELTDLEKVLEGVMHRAGDARRSGPRTTEAARPGDATPPGPPIRPAGSTPAPGTSTNGHSSAAAVEPRLGKAERAVLTVLAQFPGGRTTKQVALLAGYSMNGGGFRNALGRLRSLALIEGSKDLLRITEAGDAACPEYEPLPSGAALIDHWERELGAGNAVGKVFRALADAHPRSLSVEELAQRTGYVSTGGGFRNALGRLRTLELIEGSGELRAADELFEGVPA